MKEMRGSRSRRGVALVAVVAASVVAFASLGGVGLAQSAVGLAQYQYGKKVTICHKGKNTIRISTRAWPAHKRHGDTLGTCAAAKKKAHAKAHAKKAHAKAHAKKEHAKKHAKKAKSGGEHGKKAEQSSTPAAAPRPLPPPGRTRATARAARAPTRARAVRARTRAESTRADPSPHMTNFEGCPVSAGRPSVVHDGVSGVRRRSQVSIAAATRRAAAGASGRSPWRKKANVSTFAFVNRRTRAAISSSWSGWYWSSR